MKVAVIELRIEGRKRPRAEVLADKPIIGYLIFSPDGAYLQSQREAPPTVGEMLPSLCRARITRISRGSMVIVGGYVDPENRGPLHPLIPQAWWVRPIGHAGIPFVEEVRQSSMPPGSYR